MLWLILFADLVAPFAGGGGVDASLYRQVMADHHLRGGYDHAAGFVECAQVANLSSELENTVGPAFTNANWRPVERSSAQIHFSWIGWSGSRAFVELKTSDATWCELYRSSGASYRLVREVRFPSHE